MADVSDPKSLADQAARVYQEGDFESAARLFGEAASAFKVAGNELDAAEMKNNQSVSCLQAGNAQSSLDAAAGTAEIFSAAGDARRQGIAFGNEATALQSLGRLEQAIEKYRRSAEAFNKAGEDQMRAAVMQAVAGIQLRRGKILQALVDLQDGLASVRNPTLKQRFMRWLLRFRTW